MRGARPFFSLPFHTPALRTRCRPIRFGVCYGVWWKWGGGGGGGYGEGMVGGRACPLENEIQDKVTVVRWAVNDKTKTTINLHLSMAYGYRFSLIVDAPIMLTHSGVGLYGSIPHIGIDNPSARCAAVFSLRKSTFWD